MTGTQALLYYKIYRDLQYKIGTGELRAGQELPTDAQLEKIYGVSRSPVRQALDALKNEGLIIRGAGRRTRVAEKDRTFPWLSATGFTRHFARDWQRTSTRTLLLEWGLPDPEAARFLDVPAGVKTAHVKQLRYLDDEPIHLSHFFLGREGNEALFDLLQRAGDFMSIKELLFSSYGRNVSYVSESVAACALEPEGAGLLGLPAGSPALQIYQYCYDENRRPFVFTLRYARTEKWRFEADFAPRGLYEQGGSRSQVDFPVARMPEPQAFQQ